MNSAYITDSQIREKGSGGGVVSYHELNALKNTTHVNHIYQRVGRLHLEETYPNNPFMFDYYIASLIENPDEIGLAQFYGSGFTLTAKRLAKAQRFITVPAHNLKESLTEWVNTPQFGKPPIHLTDDSIFRLLVQSLKDAHVICPSNASAKYLKEAELATDITVIPHGTDLPEQWNTERSEFKVFNLGQYGPDKGHKYLFASWQLLGEKFRGDLIVAGIGGNQPQRPASNLVIYGYITEMAKNSFYAESSVYVQPSVTEGFGLEVLEAMSYGTPVIVTTGVGASDVVEDGKDGFIVPTRNPELIADRIAYFYSNPSEVKRMGQNARAKAEQYSWQKIEKKYEEIYVRSISGGTLMS